PAEIPIESWQLRRLDDWPCFRPYRNHRHAWWHHPTFLRSGDDDVELPLIDGQGDRANAAHAIDDDGLPTLLDDRRNLPQRIGNAGRGLVVRDQHRRDTTIGVERLRNLIRIGCRAPLESQPGHIRAESARDRAEALAE